MKLTVTLNLSEEQYKKLYSRAFGLPVTPGDIAEQIVKSQIDNWK